MIVICDTNIWYDVYSGNETLQKSKFEYYGTAANIIDFIVSDKMRISEAETQKLKNGILSMNDNSDGMLFYDINSVAADKLFDIGVNESENQAFWGMFSMLLDYANNRITGIVGPTVDGILQIQEEFRVQTLKTKKLYLKLFASKGYKKKLRRSCPMGVNFKEFRRRRNRDNIRGSVMELLEDNLRSTFNIDHTHSVRNWSQARIFIKAYAEFLKRASNSQMPNKNSLIDIMQLLYINEYDSNILFWTKEVSVNNIIRSITDKRARSILYEDYI